MYEYNKFNYTFLIPHKFLSVSKKKFTGKKVALKSFHSIAPLPPKRTPPHFATVCINTHTHIDISPTISLDWLGFVHDSVYPITHNPHSQTQHSLHCMFQPSYKHAIPQQNSATCVQRLDDSQNLQFTLLIALCYVLHRYTTQEIRR